MKISVESTEWRLLLYCFQVKLEFGNVGLNCGGRKTAEHPEKNPRSTDKNHQQTQSTYDAETWNRTRATTVGGECPHPCAIWALIIVFLVTAIL